MDGTYDRLFIFSVLCFLEIYDMQSVEDQSLKNIWEKVWKECSSLESFLPFWKTAVTISKNCKLIGLDWGTKRIGVAVSDRRGMIASPLTTILCQQNKRLPPPHARRHLVHRSCPLSLKSDDQLLDETISKLLAILEAEQPIVAVGLGVPLNLNGSVGFQSERVLAFAQRLRGHLQDRMVCPLVLYDERWSSQAVERLMIDADRTRLQRQKVVDSAAAAYVLQGVLDYLNHACH